MENIFRNGMDMETKQVTEKLDSSPEKISNESELPSLAATREQSHIVNAETVRHNLFLQAGITTDRLAELVLAAINANEEMLTAFKWQDGTKQPDNAARNRAIDSIYDLTGVKAPKASTNKSSKVTLHISDTQPEWYRNPVMKEVPHDYDAASSGDGPTDPDGSVDVQSEGAGSSRGESMHDADDMGAPTTTACEVDTTEREAGGVGDAGIQVHTTHEG